MRNILSKWAPVAGPALFLFVTLLDLNLAPKQQMFLAIFVFVVYNWLIASMPLFAVGFLGVAMTSAAGIEDASVLLASFGHPIVFLFFAGFLFAKSMSKIGLDRRISLMILSKSFVNKSFDRLIFSLFAICAFFSLWVSNTATTAMMLPIVLGVAKSLDIKDEKTLSLILLGLAYSASVGGIGSPVGSTPNIIVLGMLEELAGIKIGFFEWLLVGIPLMTVFVFMVFLYIKAKIPAGAKVVDTKFIDTELKRLPTISSCEKWLVGLFLVLIAAWFIPGMLGSLFGKTLPALMTFSDRMNPGMTGIFLASFLFIFPLGSKEKLLTQTEMRDIDWGSLLLFGSGLALGKTLFSTGIAQMAGNLLVQNVSGSGFLALMLAISFFTIFSTELVSNTATANILIPIIIAASAALNVTPVLPAIAVALCCSLAFMLPVATPPNAIVYGSGKVDIPTMVKFGFLLNVIFALVISFLFYFLKFAL